MRPGPHIDARSGSGGISKDGNMASEAIGPAATPASDRASDEAHASEPREGDCQRPGCECGSCDCSADPHSVEAVAERWI